MNDNKMGKGGSDGISLLQYARLIGGPDDGVVLAMLRLPRAISRSSWTGTQTYYRLAKTDMYYHLAVYGYYVSKDQGKGKGKGKIK